MRINYEEAAQSLKKEEGVNCKLVEHVKTACLKRKPKPKHKKAEYTPPEGQSVSLQQNREPAAKCNEFKIAVSAM